MTSAQPMATFVSYLHELDPRLENATAGASDEEIDQLEQRVQRTFAAPYRAFLRFLGNTPCGALNPFLHSSSFAISDVIEQDESRRGDGLCLPSGLTFWLHKHHQFEWFLEEIAGRDDDLQIVSARLGESENDAVLGRLYPSFFGFLFHRAFAELRMLSYEHQFQLLFDFDDETPPEERMAEARDIVLNLKFAPIPRVEEHLAGYAKTDAGVSLGREFSNLPFSCWIGSDSAREAKRLTHILQDHLGGVIQPLPGPLHEEEEGP